MGSFLNLLKLIELSFKTRQKYDLLVKHSLTLSLFWFLILIAPMVPYSQSIPVLAEYSEYATRGFFIFSLRSIMIVLLPLVFGMLYLASDEFEGRNAYRPIKTNDFIEGLQILSNKHDLASKELLNICMVAIGKGVILIFNWIIIYFLIVLGVVVELWSHFVTKDAKDEFFELLHYKDEDNFTNEVRGLVKSETDVHKTGEYQDVPLLQKPLLYLGKIFLGDITLITSENIDVLITRSGVGGIGRLKELRKFYKNLIEVLLLDGILCKFPLAIEMESKAREGSIGYELLYREENVPIEDIKWIRIKELLDYGKIKKE